jgi:hypothetical protein
VQAAISNSRHEGYHREHRRRATLAEATARSERSFADEKTPVRAGCRCRREPGVVSARIGSDGGEGRYRRETALPSIQDFDG